MKRHFKSQVVQRIPQGRIVFPHFSALSNLHHSLHSLVKIPELRWLAHVVPVLRVSIFLSKFHGTPHGSLPPISRNAFPIRLAETTHTERAALRLSQNYVLALMTIDKSSAVNCSDL